MGSVPFLSTLDFVCLLLAAHVSHLENVSEEEMNRLLGIVLDVEYLFTCVHKEEDADTKQVYFYLFKASFCFLEQLLYHYPAYEFQEVGTDRFLYFWSASISPVFLSTVILGIPFYQRIHSAFTL